MYPKSRNRNHGRRFVNQESGKGIQERGYRKGESGKGNQERGCRKGDTGKVIHNSAEVARKSMVIDISLHHESLHHDPRIAESLTYPK